MIKYSDREEVKCAECKVKVEVPAGKKPEELKKTASTGHSHKFETDAKTASTRQTED